MNKKGDVGFTTIKILKLILVALLIIFIVVIIQKMLNVN